jgi:hypothetical protein
MKESMYLSELSLDKAKLFYKLLDSGVITKNVLPNTAEDYSENTEVKDFQAYVGFLNSSDYDDFCDSFKEA